MAAYLLRRLLLVIPTLFGIIAINFVVIQFAPGGPVEQMVAELKGKGDLSSRLGGTASEFGGSGSYRGARGLDPHMVADIRQKMPVSISLGLWSTLLVYVISIPLGIAKAVRDGSRFDVASSAVVLVGYAIP